jgi:predicted nuclease of predicted toxin-antitoxin system
MKYLIDAQLPRRMANWFQGAGCDAVHTLDLPKGNATTDHDVSEIAKPDGRIVVTKDADFVSTHLLHGAPAKLLLVSTGNITNRELESLTVPLISDLDANSKYTRTLNWDVKASQFAGSFTIVATANDDNSFLRETNYGTCTAFLSPFLVNYRFDLHDG